MISTTHPDHREEEEEKAEGRIEATHMVVKDRGNIGNMRSKNVKTNGTFLQARIKEDGKNTKAKSQSALLTPHRSITSMAKK